MFAESILSIFEKFGKVMLGIFKKSFCSFYKTHSFTLSIEAVGRKRR